jgi:hypothetical protein
LPKRIREELYDTIIPNFFDRYVERNLDLGLVCIGICDGTETPVARPCRIPIHHEKRKGLSDRPLADQPEGAEGCDSQARRCEGFELAKKFNAPLVAGYELTEIAKRKGVKTVFPLNPSGSVRIDDVTITATPAIHSSGYPEGENILYAGIAMGYVVAEDGAPVFYHAGDTGVFSDMALIYELYSPTIALLPIGGTYTMKPSEAALAVRNLSVRTVVPMHFGTYPALTGTAEELSRELKRRGIPTVVFVLKPGQEVSLKELGSAR